MIKITPPQAQNALIELSGEEQSISILLQKYCIIIANSNSFPKKNFFPLHMIHSVPLIRTGIESCKAVLKQPRFL